MNIFISSYGLAQEPHLARRIIEAFPTLRLVSQINQAALYLGIFGADTPEETLAEFDTALRARMAALVFVRRTNTPEATMRRLESEHPLRFYDSSQDFAARLYSALSRWLRDRGGWVAPPLPLRPQFFAGRGQALDDLAEQVLKATSPLLLTGAAGVGKTALALELAYHVRESFKAGVFWLEYPDSQPVQASIKRLADAHPAGRAARDRTLTPAEVRAWLSSAEGRGLVIVDEIGGDEGLRELRESLPGNFTLLALSSAQTPAPFGWTGITLHPLTADDGLAILGRWFAIPENLAEDTAQPLREIVEAVGGNPLALRLAAAWMARAGGWQAGLMYGRRLNESPSIFPSSDEQNSPNAVLGRALSLLYNTFTAREKRIFCEAGVFAPDVPFEADALLSATTSTATGQDLVGLAESVLIADERAAGYRLHHALSPYALALLSESERLAAQGGHLLYYEGQAALRAGESEVGESSPLDLPQFRHAFAFARQAAPGKLPAYTLAVGAYFALLHYPEQVIWWLEETHARLDERRAQPTVLRALGDLAARMESSDLAMRYYEGALLLYYDQKSLSGQANTLKAMGDMRAAAGALEEAQDYYDRTLQLYAQIDFQLGRANTLKALGDLSLQGESHAAARDYFERALALYDQIDFTLGQAQTLQSLGDLNQRETDFATAREVYGQAVELFRDLQFATQQAATLRRLGDLETAAYNPSAALTAYGDSLRIARAHDDRENVALTLESMGRAFVANSEMVAARDALVEARDLYRAARLNDHAARINLELAEVYLILAEPVSALTLVLGAYKVFEDLGDKEAVENTRRRLREMVRGLGGSFAPAWSQATGGAEIPDWLRLAPASSLPQKLVYAVRDFILAEDLPTARRIVEAHADILLGDDADEVFARMLRQYAGQVGPTRQIDQYRILLARCRQVGIAAAFTEAETERPNEADNQVKRLHQSLDAYDESLIRLRDIPLVYASIQLNRAGTLRELATFEGQDRSGCLSRALDAYEDALRHLESTPLDYVAAQIQRADTLGELAALPDVDKARYLRERLAAYEDALRFQRDLPIESTQSQLAKAATLHDLAMVSGENTPLRMNEALAVYEELLPTLESSNRAIYAQTQARRGLLLHEMAGLSGEDFRARMMAALTAYDEALEVLRDSDPLEYARTQAHRVALLRDMAGLPGEERTARLYQALAASNEALRYLTSAPMEYAQAQIIRAHLQREIAGLSGEQRLARMREALATYNDALEHLRPDPLEYAAAQSSRVALLRELSSLAGEDRETRLKQALFAAAESLQLFEDHDTGGQRVSNARRMLINTRKSILKTESEAVFLAWWAELIGGEPPEWLAG